MLVWQVCLASVCLHIRRKSNCILCVLASRRVCAVPLLPTAVQVYVGFSGCYVPLALHSLVHHPLYHLGTAMHCPLVCPVSPMVMSEKEDADEDKAKGYSMAWKLPGNSNKPERIKSEAISTLPEPA